MARKPKKSDPWLPLRGLTRVEDTWEFGYRPVDIPIEDGSDPYMLIVAERDTGLVRLGTLTATEPTADEQRAAVYQAMMEPMAGTEGVRPANIVVDTAAAQMALALPLRRAGVANRRLPELPRVDDAVYAFHEHMDAQGQGPALPTPLHAHAEAIHAVAARFAVMAPWNWLYDGDVLSLRMDAGEWSAPVAVVLGAAKEVHGLSLYRTRESYEACAAASDEDPSVGAEATDALALWFDPADELPASFAQSFADAGLAIGDDLLPTFMRLRPGGHGVPASDEQSADVLNLALPAVVAFLERYLEQLKSDFTHLSLRHHSEDGRVVEVESRPDWRPHADEMTLPFEELLPLDRPPLIDEACANLLTSMPRAMLPQISGLGPQELERQGLAAPGADVPVLALRAAGAKVARWLQAIDELQATALLILPLPHLDGIPVVAFGGAAGPTLITVLEFDFNHRLDALVHSLEHGGRVGLFFGQGPATKSIRRLSSRAFRGIRFFDLVGAGQLNEILAEQPAHGAASRSHPAAATAPATATRCYDIRVALDGISPPIWRRFLLPVNATMHDLHDAIQDSFGWEHAHLACFETQGRNRRTIAEVDVWGGAMSNSGLTLERLVGQGLKKFTYIYDFGDNWRHRVTIRKEVQEDGPLRRRLLSGKRACPPEDCGSVSGYDRMCEFLQTGVDPFGDPAVELAEWLGDWQPEAFDLEAESAKFAR